MHDSTNPTRSTPTRSAPSGVLAAAAHAEQARLLLLRVATESPDPLRARHFRDLAEILGHVERLATLRELGATR